MKKKLIILVVITFFLSTVGFPISLHYCEMQRTTSISMCEICAAENTKEVKSCCEEDDYNSLLLKSDNSNQCCETKIIDKSISDNFLSFKVEIKQEHSLSIIFLDNSLANYSNKIIQSFLNQFKSPPLSHLNALYLQNSVFLI